MAWLKRIDTPAKQAAINQGGNNFTAALIAHNLNVSESLLLRCESLHLQIFGVGKEDKYTVSRHGSKWSLTVHNVRRDDGGTYYCQINTVPPISQAVQLQLHGDPNEYTMRNPVCAQYLR